MDRSATNLPKLRIGKPAGAYMTTVTNLTAGTLLGPDLPGDMKSEMKQRSVFSMNVIDQSLRPYLVQYYQVPVVPTEGGKGSKLEPVHTICIPPP